MATQQQTRVTAVIKRGNTIVRQLGVWDTLSGAEVTAEIPTNRPGGSQVKKSYAALPETSDLTIGRVRERERDHELDRWLRTQVGKVVLEVSEQPLDDDFVPWGAPIVSRGRLSGVTSSEVDSNGTDLRRLEVTAIVEAQI